MKVREIIIEGVQDKIEYIANSMGDKIVAAAQEDRSAPTQFGMGGDDTLGNAEHILELLAKADPSGDRADALQWLARMYASGQMRIEDVDKMRQELQTFYQYRNKMPNKDLNSYSTLDSFYDAVEAVSAKPPEKSKRKQKKEIKQEGAEKVIDTPNFTAIKITSPEASCYYAANTKWCTSDASTAESYLREGPLYVLVAKIGGKSKKFQLQYEGDQFMNERDTPVTKADIAQLSKLPGYTEFLNKLIQEHYGPYFK